MTLLAIEWHSIAVKTGQFILSFSILVILHELGHFLPARWFKCRVEKFYLFFNPWFSLFKKKIGETEYGLGWVPFGGYVKISGMIDESMDKEQLKQPAQPWEFRSKPAWQRLIIMLGGVTVNVVLAIVIFIMIMWIWGEEYVPPQNVKYGIVADSLGKKIGLKDGDVIVKVGDKPAKNFARISAYVILEEPKTLTVLRNGDSLTIPVPDDFVKAMNKSKGYRFVDLRLPFIAAGFSKDSPGEKAGIKVNDHIIGIDSAVTPFFNDFSSIVRSKPGQEVKVKLIRNEKDTMEIPATVGKDGKLGIAPLGDFEKFGIKIETDHYSFAESIPRGFRLCWETLGNYIAGIRQLFNGKANPNDSLGSVISIAKIFPDEWIWQNFWKLTAVFSIILAFMNVLPIPALDGGHALFTLAEMITGRKPGDKFIEYAQMVGMVLLLGLMAYALGLDIWRSFK